ncbi:MAG: GAF domain-containing sensor histidine kinase, partial [Candidatus Omnitrophota bacterium]
GFFPVWNILAFPALFLFFSYMFASFINLIKEYKKELSPLEKTKIKYILIAFLGAYTGSVDYLPTFGIEIYPFGYLSIALFLTIVGYTIVKYQLMDIRVVVTRAGLILLIYSPVLILPFISGNTLNGSNLWYIPILAALVLASAGPYIYNKIRKRAEDIILAKQKQYQSLLMQASKDMTLIKELDKLLKLLAKVMSKGVNVAHVSIFIQDSDKNAFALRETTKKSEDKLRIKDSVPKNNSLVKFFQKHKRVLIYDELSTMKSSQSISGVFKSLKAEVIVPFIIQNELIGFMALGKKVSGEMYTKDDIGVFQILSYQVALAIENAVFYEETGKSLAQQFHEHRLKSLGQMGSKMGHQVNNRFHAILIEIEKAHYLTLKKLKETPLTAKQKNIIKELDKLMGMVEKEAVRGGDIAKRLTSFSRKGIKIIPVDLNELITSIMPLLSCKFDVKELNLKIDIEDTELKVRGDIAQLQDIFFNLLDNANDAHTRKREYHDKSHKSQTNINACIKNNMWHIEIKDNGEGMNSEDLEQLFLPFFTTKGADKGTGLGLSIIKQMINQLGGTIIAESVHLKGTKFHIKLPAIAREQQKV